MSMKPLRPVKVPAGESGFTIVTTIFIVVILASLAIFMVTLGTTQRATSTFSIIGSRAFYAARSGVEWGVDSVLSNGVCFANPTTFTLNGGMTSGFDVELNCTSTAVTEGPDVYNVYNLQVTASRGQADQDDYFSRTITASVTDAL